MWSSELPCWVILGKVFFSPVWSRKTSPAPCLFNSNNHDEPWFLTALIYLESTYLSWRVSINLCFKILAQPAGIQGLLIIFPITEKISSNFHFGERVPFSEKKHHIIPHDARKVWICCYTPFYILHCYTIFHWSRSAHQFAAGHEHRPAKRRSGGTSHETTVELGVNFGMGKAYYYDIKFSGINIH